MLGNWNYENYTKSIVPLILGVVALLQGLVETGGLEKAEINTVIYLVAAALIVFLAPNQKIAKGPEIVEGDPNRSQQILSQHAAVEPNAVPQTGQPNVEKPLAGEVTAEQTTRRRRTPKE
jgi:hypothetical protein